MNRDHSVVFEIASKYCILDSFVDLDGYSIPFLRLKNHCQWWVKSWIKRYFVLRTSLAAQMVKRLSTVWETWVWSLGWEDSLEKELATHSSTLALKIPWTEELGAGFYPWGCKESGMTVTSLYLVLGREVMIHLDNILKSRDITLPTKVLMVKVMIFPVIMYSCESWTIEKAKSWRIDAFELWCWRRLESPFDSKDYQPSQS